MCYPSRQLEIGAVISRRYFHPSQKAREIYQTVSRLREVPIQHVVQERRQTPQSILSPSLQRTNISGKE
ncbi:ORF421 [White spot syndrome virus]|uniref:Wsv391 n=3 Tax=White spot syndrome virus TaxID=342409 RepID=A0A0A0Y908_WSSVS|nr:wsv391 [Shrimp white spot syndrome virus]AFX59768.1 wsv391 [White spot syndrome virus]AAL89318.1 WSSV450 [Shrimp white spot syndrome virus]AIX03683.1 wsv391 [Shrimp white spot syndrome virus]ATU84030.1 ORF421 [White spot syndrome virus]AWQ60516.1 wsv391 [Shrimp white spot syndrome virus]